MTTWGDLSYMDRAGRPTFGQRLRVGGFGHLPGGKPAKKPSPSPTYKPSLPAPATSSAATGSASPGPATLPLDPSYDATLAALTHSRDDSLAGLAQQQTSTLSNYGYGATFDDQGNVTGLTFDPSNPYSQAALLRKNYQQAKTGTANSMAARGQLYAGASQQAQDIQDNSYLQREDALQKALTSALVGLAQRRRQVGTNFETQSAQAFGDRVARAANSDTGESALASPAAPAGSPPAPAAVVPGGYNPWLAAYNRRKKATSKKKK